MNHWKNGRTHQSEYPELKTPQDYEQYALALIEKPTGGDILGHVDKNGVIIRYNKATNDFVKGHPDLGIRTMFKPADGLQYYLDQKRSDCDHGGRDR